MSVTAHPSLTHDPSVAMSGEAVASMMTTKENATAAAAAVLIKNNATKSDAKDFRRYDVVVVKEEPVEDDVVDDTTMSKQQQQELQRRQQQLQQRVSDHYRDMRTNQTVDFYRRMEAKYSFANGAYRRLMTIEEAFAELDHYVVRITCVCVERECKRRISTILSSSHCYYFALLFTLKFN
jgi:hypothetical protein